MLSKFRGLPDPRERTCEWMLAVHFGVAVRANEEDRIGGDKMRHMIQHRHCATVGPVQIVQHQHQRRTAAKRGNQELRYRVEQSESAPLPYRSGTGFGQYLPMQVAQRRRDARK